MLAAGRRSEVTPGKQCLPSEERPVYWVLIYEYREFFPICLFFFFKFVSSFGLELVKSSYVNFLRLLETSSHTASQRSFLRWSQYSTLAQRSRSHGIFSFHLYLSYLQLGECRRACRSLRSPWVLQLITADIPWDDFLMVSTLSRSEAGWTYWGSPLFLCPAPISTVAWL